MMKIKHAKYDIRRKCWNPEEWSLQRITLALIVAWKENIGSDILKALISNLDKFSVIFLVECNDSNK